MNSRKDLRQNFDRLFPASEQMRQVTKLAVRNRRKKLGKSIAVALLCPCHQSVEVGLVKPVECASCFLHLLLILCLSGPFV